MKPKDQEDRSESLENRIEQFVTDPVLARIFVQEGKLDIKDVLSFNGSLIVRIPIADLGTDTARLIAAIVLSRVLYEARKRKRTYLLLDNLHLFPAKLVKDALLAGGPITIAAAVHYLDAIDDDLRLALLGFAGQLVAFRTGPFDAKLLDPLFGTPNNVYHSVTQIAPYEAYVRRRETELVRMEPITRPAYSVRPIVERCRTKYGTPRAAVEKRLQTFLSGL